VAVSEVYTCDGLVTDIRGLIVLVLLVINCMLNSKQESNITSGHLYTDWNSCYDFFINCCKKCHIYKRTFWNI